MKKLKTSIRTVITKRFKEMCDNQHQPTTEDIFTKKKDKVKTTQRISKLLED